MIYTFFSECNMQVTDVFIMYIAINYNYTIKLFLDMYEYVMQINITQIFVFNFKHLLSLQV